jgi:hypothetical protein
MDVIPMINAYATFYPYAVITIAIVASCCTIFGGAYAFTVMLRYSTNSVLQRRQAQRRAGDTIDDRITPSDILPWVMGGTAIFVAACLAAMIELKIGAWVASIGCGT